VSDDFPGGFPRSGPPRKVKGGIRAHSKKGAFARSWWARRWLAVLESLQLGGRLARGRAYARGGQVMDLSIEAGLVRARVQGSRVEPYAVTIRVTPLSSGEWRRLADVLAREVVFLARLLAGEMPSDIERAFDQAGLSLFPTRIDQLATACSCPDPSNPCKHIAAVYYLLGEEFDRDPFLIFRLRGMSREELLRRLEEMEQAAHPTAREGDATEGHGGERNVDAPTLDAKPNASFWRAGAVPEDVPERIIGRHPELCPAAGRSSQQRSRAAPGRASPAHERAATAALVRPTDAQGLSADSEHRLTGTADWPRERSDYNVTGDRQPMNDTPAPAWYQTGNVLGSAVDHVATLSPRFNWVGIYVLKGDVLELGAYIGAPMEHTKIPVGVGVCGAAVAGNKDMNVPDVTAVENYLACSLETVSELVVLIRARDGRILGQIDIDSHTRGAFGPAEEEAVRRVALELGDLWPD
jgi:uncharacterized Zn finger protein/putative methionine-R-sulfoxide reductase with GAF domain